MMTIRIGFFILFGVLPGGLAFAQVGDGQEGFRRSYSILLERNIFSRDRRPYRPERERSTTQALPPPIESTLVLLGIGRQQGQTLAFVEDTLTGRIERHAVGSSIARGTKVGIRWLGLGPHCRGVDNRPNHHRCSISTYLWSGSTSSELVSFGLRPCLS